MTNMSLARNASMLLAAATLSISARAAGPATAPAAYFGNSLICKQADGPRCQMWLDADGRYSIFYDMGSQPKAPIAGSQFRLEGRSGRYAVRGGEICLKPDTAAGAHFGSDRDGLPFARAACYPLSAHKLGDSWQDGKFTYWLVEGR